MSMVTPTCRPTDARCGLAGKWLRHMVAGIDCPAVFWLGSELAEPVSGRRVRQRLSNAHVAWRHLSVGAKMARVETRAILKESRYIKTISLISFRLGFTV